MKITDINPLKPSSASGVRKKPGVSGASFADFLDAADEAASTADTAPATSIAPPSTLDGVLALQEVPDSMVRKQKAIKRADQSLEELDKLRGALLSGRVPAYLLRNLSNILQQHRERADDPHLNAILDEIELRAAVELAKLEMAQQAAAGNTNL